MLLFCKFNIDEDVVEERDRKYALKIIVDSNFFKKMLPSAAS